MLSRRREEQPYRRVGICCGSACRHRDKARDVVLFKVYDNRYRCRGCFKRERGYWP